MRIAAAILLVISVAAQSSNPSFDVATVKVSRNIMPPRPGPEGAPPPPPPPPALRLSPQSVTFLSANLKYCLAWAYNLRQWQISGPDWIESEHYDITAKTSAPAPVERQKAMMQALLTDRFRMTLRHDKREAKVLALVLSGDAPKFRAAAADETPASNLAFTAGGVRTEYKNKSVAELEGMLNFQGWDPVVDRTGLTGGYDFVFEMPRPSAEDGGSRFPRIQSALQKQLGLKLEPVRASMDFLVVERAEKKPVEN